jgi:hypothetical protein
MQAQKLDSADRLQSSYYKHTQDTWTLKCRNVKGRTVPKEGKRAKISSEIKIHVTSIRVQWTHGPEPWSLSCSKSSKNKLIFWLLKKFSFSLVNF